MINCPNCGCGIELPEPKCSEEPAPDTKAYIDADTERAAKHEEEETKRTEIQADAAVKIAEQYADAAEAAADAAKTEAELDAKDHELHEEKEEKEHKDVDKAEDEAEVVKETVAEIPTENRNEEHGESQPTPTDSQIADAEIAKDRAPRQTHRWWR